MFHDFVCILVHKTYGITVDVSYYIDTVWGGVVEEVRTIFERRNDTTIYIPSICSNSV